MENPKITIDGILKLISNPPYNNYYETSTTAVGTTTLSTMGGGSTKIAPAKMLLQQFDSNNLTTAAAASAATATSTTSTTITTTATSAFLQMSWENSTLGRYGLMMTTTIGGRSVDVIADSATVATAATADSMHWDWGELLLVCVLCVLIVITVIGNTLVILAVLTTRRLRTVTNCFVMSLAVADWLVGIFVMPPAVAVHLIGKSTFLDSKKLF